MREVHPWRIYMNKKRFGVAGVIAAFALAVSTLVAPTAGAASGGYLHPRQHIAQNPVQR